MKEEKKTTIVSTPVEAKEKDAKVAIFAAAKESKYDQKAKEYTSKATIGVRCAITSKGVYLVVSNCWIGIKPNNEGKCEFKEFNKSFKSYEKEDSEAKFTVSEQTFLAYKKLLQAKYSITDKPYSLLVDLARKGIPLMTKKEKKALKAKDVA